jgi:hypothetical protein
MVQLLKGGRRAGVEEKVTVVRLGYVLSGEGTCDGGELQLRRWMVNKREGGSRERGGKRERKRKRERRGKEGGGER